MSIAQTTERASETAQPFRAGSAAIAPFIIGLSPIALVLGSTLGSSRSPWAAWAGVWPIFGASAHIATVRALQDGGLVVAVISGLAVNGRVAAYGFAVAPHWKSQPWWFRVLAPCFLVDATFATFEQAGTSYDSPTDQRRFYLSASLTLGVAYFVLVTAGMFIGRHIDAKFGLDVMVPLSLAVSLGARLQKRPMAVAALSGVLVALVSRHWPLGTGVLAALVLGTVAGSLADRDDS